MPRYRPNPQNNPEKPGGKGWLVNDQQQLVCQFKLDTRSSHAQLVSLRTYSWIPPRQPVPQTQRRMLRHNAVEAWQTMLKTGVGTMCATSALIGSKEGGLSRYSNQSHISFRQMY